MAWTENPFSQFPNRYIWPDSFGFGAYCSGVASVSATQSATLGITRVLEQDTSCHDPPQNPIATRTVSTSDGRLERVWRMSSFIFEGSMWYCDLIQWWESLYCRYSEPVVHIPEVWCRKKLLYSYRFLSDFMIWSVFSIHFKHIFSCIFQKGSIVADSSKKNISLIDGKHTLRKNLCMIWR